MTCVFLFALRFFDCHENIFSCKFFMMMLFCLTTKNYRVKNLRGCLQTQKD